jgi:predicted nucleic-acid-binding Zn-ribbon protein
VLTKWHHLVERTCKSCGTTWLVTGKQARFYPGRPRGARQRNVNGYDVTPQFTADAGIDMLDRLRSCPKCNLETYSERAVTKAMPASPGASRGLLDT